MTTETDRVARVLKEFTDLGREMLANPEGFPLDLMEAYAAESKRLGKALLKAADEIEEAKPRGK